MHFIPTYCDACERSALVLSNVIQNGTARCQECQGPSRSLPGQSYAEADIALFDDLRAALREANVTRQTAASLANQLASNPGSPGRGLRRLAHLVPSLGILELIVGNQPAALRKAEGMLAILLEAIATGPRCSSVFPMGPSGEPSSEATSSTKTG